MRTQGGHNAEVRLSISCPSAEKTDSQIHRLKPTLPVYHRFYLRFTEFDGNIRFLIFRSWISRLEAFSFLLLA